VDVPSPGYCETQGRTKENVNIHTGAFQRVALLRNVWSAALLFLFCLGKKTPTKKKTQNQKVPVCVLKHMEIIREQPYNLIC